MKITFEVDEDTTWTIEGDDLFQLIWGLNDVFQEEELLEKSEEIHVVTSDERYILDKAGI